MRLIDADVLLDKLYENEYSTLCPLDEVSGVIDCCPTVDAEPVRHGRWKNRFGDYSTAECDLCKSQYEVSDTDVNCKMLFDAFVEFYKYCPSCGAFMRREKDD